VHPREPFLDPLDGWRLEDVLAARAEAHQFFSEVLDFVRGLYERLGQATIPTALANEVDEVGQSAFFRRELRFLQANGVRDVGIEFADLVLDTRQDLAEDGRGGEPLAEGVEEQSLDEGAADEELVVTGPFGGRQAAVVAAAFATDLGDDGATLATAHGAGEQVSGKMPFPASLRWGEAAASRTAGPSAAHGLSTRVHVIPQRLGDDAERFIIVGDPL